MHLQLFDELLAKQMTRKEFLVHLGILFLAITGISGVLKTLSDPHITSNRTNVKTGFGGGRYGG